MTNQDMTITPIDATLGAVVTDISLKDLDDEAWSSLYATFLEYGILVFPGQHLSDSDQDVFARRFGDIEQLSPLQKGATVRISNKKADGSVATIADPQFKLLRGNEGWHTDSTYMPLASKAAMLAAITVPSEDGETEFADMRAAWDALDADLQARLEPLSAYHSLYYSQERAGFTHDTDNLYGFHDKGAPLRPVVKTHPETGRKSLYTGRHAYGIPGMDPQASEALLTNLLSDACQPPRTYKHTWTPGDIVVWDNRCVMHRARPYDTTQERVLRGSRVAGEAASELAPTFADERAGSFNPTTSNKSSAAAGATAS
jgi:alpha-ketoglutarate-dependent taurine dioxygenase